MANESNPGYWLDQARKAEAAGKSQLEVLSLVDKARAAKKRRELEGRGYKVLEEFDQGRIVQGESGKMTYAGSGFSTSDPADIALIRELGGNEAEYIKQKEARNIISQTGEGLSRLTSAIKGIPYIGEYFDEMVGATVGDKQMQQARLAAQAREDIAPGTVAASRVATGVGTAIPLAAGQLAMLPANLAGRVLGGAALGAAEGGLEGYISGYGSGTDTASRQKAAAERATTGAAFGGALGGALPLATGAAGQVARQFIEAPAKDVGRKIGAQDQALELLSRAAEVDAPTAAANLERAGQYASMGQMGPTMQGLLDIVAQSPFGGSIARQNIEEVAGQAGVQFNNLLDDTLGGPVAAQQVKDLLMETTSTARKNAYDAAYEATIDFGRKEADEMLDLLERVNPSILDKAANIARMEGVPSLNKLVKIGDDGTIEGFTDLPDMRFVDYVTRALNDVEGVGAAEVKNAQRSLAAQIREKADKLVPEYGQARDLAASVIDIRNAIDLGETMLKPGTKVYDVELAVKTMKGAEKNALKQGLRSYLDETMGNVKTSLTDPNLDVREVLRGLKDLSSRNNQTKIKAILGDAEAKEFMRQFDEVYSAMNMRASSARQSATLPRQMFKEAAEDVVKSRETTGQLMGERGPMTGAMESFRRSMPNQAPSTTESMELLARELALPLTRQVSLDELIRQQQQLRRAAPQLQRGREVFEGASRAGTIAAKGLTMGAVPGLLDYYNNR
jgi:hypothetical protein